jgi:hypothetical protein
VTTHQEQSGKNDKKKAEKSEMPGLPFLQIFIDDWRQDTKFLSLEVRGAWLEMLLEMHRAEPRGQLTITIKKLTRLLGDNSQKTVDILGSLKTEGVAEIEWLYNGNDENNSFVTVTNRRMYREGCAIKNARLRQKRWRDKQKGDG